MSDTTTSTEKSTDKGSNKLLIVGGAVGAVVVVVVLLVVLFVVPPSKKKVCNHMFDVYMKEAVEEYGISEEEAKEAYSEEGIADCIKALERGEEKDGIIEAGKKYRCVLKADTTEEMMKCD